MSLDIKRFPKSVFESPEDYPQRNHGISIKKWLRQDMPDKDYSPVEFLSKKVKNTSEPKNGRPINPKYRTGITNRGVLYNWGPNYVADALVTRFHNGRYEMLVIKRKSSGEWAIPGGFLDEGEDPIQAGLRELKEEAGLDLSGILSPKIIYKGYVDDPRTTDNAWIETTVVHINLPDKHFELKAGDDALDVKWMEMTNANMHYLYANHCDFAKKALIHLV